MKELKIEVLGVKERYGAKHKVGDIFFIRGEGTIEERVTLMGTFPKVLPFNSFI